MADIILIHGKIATVDPANPNATAIAMSAGRIIAVGRDEEVMALATNETKVIELNGRRVIPGLNDSHTHLIRGGLNFNMELRWEGVPSVTDALNLLRSQAQRTPAPQWVRVVGGWSEFQFAERRMPTLAEINQAAPETPVFILHLYGSALLNKAAINVLGLDKNSPNPRGGTIEKDSNGNPTGLLIATPSALILYSTLAKGPKLPIEDQINSTRHYMREMNRLGITSVIDAGGGGQNYPDDYEVIQILNAQKQLTVRIAYNLFAQNAGNELSDYEKWVQVTSPGAGDDMLQMNGAGENLVWSAADFENFLEPRPELAPIMESQLEPVVELLAANEWPFRIHATYDETIDRFLSVFERVNGNTAFATRFIIDHAETVSEKNIDRIKALGGGIAIQHRMAFQGEYFVHRYGAQAAEQTPPIQKMLAAQVPVGAGTDATRVASYNPWVSLYWLVTGMTIGGLRLYRENNTLDRETALSLWTQGSAWFSGEADIKGALKVGQYADMAVLSKDLMTAPAIDIQFIESVLTITAGKVVYGASEFTDLSPKLPPASPSWSPTERYGGAYNPLSPLARAKHSHIHIHDNACSQGCGNLCGLHGHNHQIAWNTPLPVEDKNSFWGALGCSCFAF